jgi:ferredoxin
MTNAIFVVKFYVMTGKVRLKFVMHVDAEVGDTLLEVARKNKLPMKGVCGGWARCATCHVGLEQGCCKKLPEASDDELEMLDKAHNVTQNSRLGCQVRVADWMNGQEVELRG